MTTRVYCWPASRESAYVPLLFAGVERYRPWYREDGSLEDALAEREAGRAIVVHVHWEEFVVRDCASPRDADDAAARFARQIAALRARGTPLVWTVHNEVPHEIAYHRAFLSMRAMLARAADAILVHDARAIEVLAEQTALDRRKVRILAHPSYLGRFEDEEALERGLAAPRERYVQAFGWIRLQKGLGAMIAALPQDFLAQHELRIRISGSGARASAAIAREAARADVVWDVRHVPDADVPRLLRSAMCVVLPYDRVLTSGVALVAMSVGAMLVAVDAPQIRNALPPTSRRFLYPHGDARALRDAVASVCALSDDERRTVVRANLAAARELKPETIAARLAAIYDELERRRSTVEKAGTLTTT